MDLVEKYLGEEDKMAGWIAIFNGKKLEIKKSEANGIYGAKQLAIKKLKVPKSKQGLLAIEPAYESTVYEAKKAIEVIKGKKPGEAILKVPGQKDKTYKSTSIASQDAKKLGKEMGLKVIDNVAPKYSGFNKGFEYFK